MAFQSRYLFTASMDVEPDKETLFNEVYDQEHIPALTRVAGVVAIARFVTRELTMVMGGERLSIVVENEPKYSAVYELESPQVLTSQAWGEAVEQGRWPDQVRPYTSNRRHVLRELIFPVH